MSFIRYSWNQRVQMWNDTKIRLICVERNGTFAVRKHQSHRYTLGHSCSPVIIINMVLLSVFDLNRGNWDPYLSNLNDRDKKVKDVKVWRTSNNHGLTGSDCPVLVKVSYKSEKTPTKFLVEGEAIPPSSDFSCITSTPIEIRSRRWLISLLSSYPTKV